MTPGLFHHSLPLVFYSDFLTMNYLSFSTPPWLCIPYGAALDSPELLLLLLGAAVSKVTEASDEALPMLFQLEPSKEAGLPFSLQSLCVFLLILRFPTPPCAAFPYPPPPPAP